PALLADVEKGDDVRMRQRTRDPGLVIEPVDEGTVLRALAGDVETDRLDGQRALDEGVEGLVDRPHGAVPDAVEDLVAADRLGHLVGQSSVVVHIPVSSAQVRSPGRGPGSLTRKSDCSIPVKRCQRTSLSSPEA